MLEVYTLAKIRSHAQVHVNGMRSSFQNLSSLVSDDQASPDEALEALAELKKGNAHFSRVSALPTKDEPSDGTDEMVSYVVLPKGLDVTPPLWLLPNPGSKVFVRW